MGNTSTLRPRDTAPLGVRHCLLCASCEELIYRHNQLMVRCDFSGIEMAPEKGCARFCLEVANLGEEGLAGENTGEESAQSSAIQRKVP